MSGGTNEVQARVHAQVRLLHALRLLLLDHIRLVLVINEIDDGCPGITVVDVVAEAGRVDNRELHLELLLLKLSLDDFNLSQIIKLLVVPARVVLGG